LTRRGNTLFAMPIERFVMRCLAKTPGARPASGLEALEELAAALRESGLPEPFQVPAVDAVARAAPAARRAWLRAALVWPVLWTTVSAGILAAAVRARFDPQGIVVSLVLLTASLSCLWKALSEWSRITLDDSDAWWKFYMSPPDDTSGYGMLMRFAVPSMAIFLAVLGMIADWLALPLLWLGLGILGIPGTLRGAAAMLEPALPVLTGPLAKGQSELSLELAGEGWMMRHQPAGQEGVLPRRLWLSPGLNRLEVWRGGGRRRTFLIWGPTRPSHLAAALAEGPDGPTMKSRTVK
jgi:hypothetical protein